MNVRVSRDKVVRQMEDLAASATHPAVKVVLYSSFTSLSLFLKNKFIVYSFYYKSNNMETNSCKRSHTSTQSKQV